MSSKISSILGRLVQAGPVTLEETADLRSYVEALQRQRDYLLQESIMFREERAKIGAILSREMVDWEHPLLRLGQVTDIFLHFAERRRELGDAVLTQHEGATDDAIPSTQTLLNEYRMIYRALSHTPATTVEDGYGHYVYLACIAALAGITVELCERGVAVGGALRLKDEEEETGGKPRPSRRKARRRNQVDQA